MTFFTHDDYHSLQHGGATTITQDKFSQLHRALYERIRTAQWDLHPHPTHTINTDSTATRDDTTDVLTLTYLRPLDQAQLVEHLMGIDLRGSQGQRIGLQRHPVIELRLSPEAFAIELIISPMAWWDQQNLIGKLELERHVKSFHSLLRAPSADYRFGFWEGTHLSDMQLSPWEFTHGRIFAEWMDTFAESQDWFRFGLWYAPDDPTLAPEHIVSELINRLGDLYAIYDFILWTGNNNFHSFYEKRQRQTRRLYA